MHSGGATTMYLAICCISLSTELMNHPQMPPQAIPKRFAHRCPTKAHASLCTPTTLIVQNRNQKFKNK